MDKVWFPELGHKLAQDKAKRSRLATHTHTHKVTGGNDLGGDKQSDQW